ncbi:MAG: rhamnogalacturonan lyase [Fibromonadaceae bacterium]|nr:rhamnogalacturonan lyase [Fibromonadaceae bacterium]
MYIIVTMSAEKTSKVSIIAMAVILVCTFLSQSVAGPMQVENLNRGLIAVRSGQGYYLSWRLLANEPYNTGFNVYRGSTRLNSTPITGATIYTDANTPQQSGVSTYTVRAVVGGVERPASDPAIIINNVDGPNASNASNPTAGYIQIDLIRPPTGQHGGTYSPNDGSVGDLTGNGVYDIVLKWDPSNSQDNANNGITDNVIIDAYTLTSQRLWRIDLGPNIRAGAHYTQFMVYDFDGCGKAEVIMKTAPGTRDGTGNFISMGPAATANHSAIYRNSNGHIVTGPEYLTVFDGATGRELATAEYWPVAGTVSSWGGAGRDNGGNRVNRFNAVVAYLDGERPSVVYQRGYYERMTFAAWDWRNGQLTRRWTFDSNTSGNGAYSGQGNHSLSVADVDNSGRHSIITGSAVIGPDGTGRHTMGYGHGDALHVAHMIKGNPYPQIFMPHETGNIGVSLRHANNGQVLFTANNSNDVGRGAAAQLDAARPGFHFWGSGGMGLYNTSGTRVSTTLPHNGNNAGVCNFVIWWDGDLSRQLLDNNQITKWSIANNSGQRLLTATGASSANGTKSTPILTADIFGDWREEVIWAYGNSALRIYTSTMPTTHRLVTLMHDPVYRVAVAWQNSSYNQPPHPGYYIASDMDFPPPTLNVTVVGGNNQSSSSIAPSSSSATPSSSSVAPSSSSSPPSSSSVAPPTITCTLPAGLVAGTNVNAATQRGYLRCSNTGNAPTVGTPAWSGAPRAPFNGTTVAAAGNYTGITVTANCGTNANPNNVSGTSNNIAIAAATSSSSVAPSSSSANSFTCTGLVATGTVGTAITAPTVRCNGTTVTNNLTWTPTGRIPTAAGTLAVNVSRGNATGTGSACAGMTALCGNVSVSAAPSSSSATVPSSSSSADTPSSSSVEVPSSSSVTPSSSSTDITSIHAFDSYGRIQHTPTYYDLKGQPLGITKPTAPGVYIEKQGKQVKMVVVK